MNDRLESVVLCEGYHDRAFWAGWLDVMGCQNLGRRPAGGGPIFVQDPWGRRVAGGEYAFHSRSGLFLRVSPCNGKPNVLPRAKSRLKDRLDHTLRHLVITVDHDQFAPPQPGHEPLTSRGADSVLTAEGAQPIGDGAYRFDDGTLASTIEWRTPDCDVPTLPGKQTLERLVCAAIIEAYPNRAEPVWRWLDSRPDAPVAGAKEYAFSHMAGWYAECGCDAFFRRIWKDVAVREALETRLREIGAWPVAETITR